MGVLSARPNQGRWEGGLGPSVWGTPGPSSTAPSPGSSGPGSGNTGQARGIWRDQAPRARCELSRGTPETVWMGAGWGRGKARQGSGEEWPVAGQAIAAVSGTGWEPLQPPLRPGSPKPWDGRGAPTPVAQSRASVPGSCQAPVPVSELGVGAPGRRMRRGASRVLQDWEGHGK